MLLPIESLLRNQSSYVFNDQIDMSYMIQGIKGYIGLDLVKVQGAATGKVTEEVEVSGKVETTLRCCCGTCLDEFDYPISKDFSQLFTLKEVDDEEVIQVEEEYLDLTPLIEEVVSLSFPFIPKCREDCKGLCSNCGANLNKQKCICSTLKIDPRLEKLREFFKE